MDDLTRFCSLNLQCPNHGLRGGENLSVSRRYGKDHAIRFRFSQDWRFHEAATYFTMSSVNFCWPARTRREPTGEGRYRQQTPAMAGGLADHLWSVTEWVIRPVVLRS